MAASWELLVLSVRQGMCKQTKRRMEEEKNDFDECITAVMIMAVLNNTEDLQRISIPIIIY